MKFLIFLSFLSLAWIVAARPGLPPPNLIKRATSEKPADLSKEDWDLTQKNKKLESKSGAEREGHEEEKEKNEKLRQNGGIDGETEYTNGFAPLDEVGKAAKRETWENVRQENGARQNYGSMAAKKEIEGKALDEEVKAGKKENGNILGEICKLCARPAGNGDGLLGLLGKKENEGKVRQDDEVFAEVLKKINLEEREKKENKKIVRGTDEEEFLGMKKKRELEKFALEPVEGRFGVYKTDSGHLVRLIEASGDPDARYGYIPLGPYYERRRALGSNLPPGSDQRQGGYRTSGLSRSSLANEFGDMARFWPFTSWYDDYSYYGGYGGYYPYNDYYYYDYYHYKK